MHYLVLGVPLDEIPAAVSARLHRDVTLRDVEQAAFEAARLIERHPLTAPSIAAFRERDNGRPKDVDLADVDLTTLAGVASAELDRLASSGPAIEQGEGLRLAAGYALMVMRQEDRLQAWRAEGPTGFLRAGAGDQDGRLRDLFLYRTGDAPPGHLLASWSGLVERLEEKGDEFDGCILEYINWLDIRDSLEEALCLAAPPGAIAARREIESLDLRYFDATRASNEPVASGARPSLWRPRCWWWYRVPKNGFPEMPVSG